MSQTNMLDSIGFYTLTDARARRVAEQACPKLSRCEILLTDRCNFRCPYCRHVGGDDAPLADVLRTLDLWIADGLSAVRFSGGEPTLWPDLEVAVRHAARKIPRVAVSTNGSARWQCYQALLDVGANDFSVSLDACCAADWSTMTGGNDSLARVVDNIRRLAASTYVTAGIVLTSDNVDQATDLVSFADGLGVADIRVIPAAQENATLAVPELPADVLARHAILRWRWARMRQGLPVRGLRAPHTTKCFLALDDMAVMANKHYPCIIYLRERGKPIGQVGPQMRTERLAWFKQHVAHRDAICSRNCLDFCSEYNNQVARFAAEQKDDSHFLDSF